jgi:hypothetical protein
MAKACGMRIGSRRFELFVLDGSPKKPKVVASVAGEIPPDEPDSVGAAAHALKSAIKKHGIPTDNIGLVIDARSAAFRNVNLPVAEASKIESVLKFEVESQLPQFNIDDLVVDFYIKETAADSSALLVTAVPKADISAAIDLCLSAGFEPMEIEAETTALVNAAESLGLCGVDDAQVLVHVGEDSTAVAVIDGGKVREMRVIQAGALSHTPHAVPSSGADAGPGEEREPVEEGLAEESPTLSMAGPPRPERVGEIVQRIRRELARTVSAARTVNDLRGVHVCGFVLPGMVGEDILGVPVEAIEGCALDSQEGNVHSEYKSGAVAYGAALRQMGGGIVRPRLRREELAFSGAMERLELPLAVMCLLMTTFFGVWFMFLQRERASIDRDLRFMLESTVNYMISNPVKGTTGNLEYPSDSISDYLKRFVGRVPGTDPPEFRSDPTRNRYEQLVFIRDQLKRDQKALKKQLGHDQELTQPQSALRALTLVLDLIAQSDGKYGRISFRKLQSSYHTNPREGDSVTIKIEASFFADSSTTATQNYELLFADLKQQPWYVSHETSGSDPITGAESGVYLPNLEIRANLSKAEEVKS